MQSLGGLSDVTVVVLAGGLGTRLRSVVSDRPKVLAKVHGRPFLAYLLDQLADAEIQHVVLCTGYQGEQVQKAFGNGYRGIRLSYSQENFPLGTAGALRLALPQLDSQTALVMNGDSYCSADLKQFWSWYCVKGYEGSLLLTQVLDTSRYGRVQAAEEGRVLKFEEKKADSKPGWINAGMYLLNLSMLEKIPENRAVSLEREMLPQWIYRPFGGYKSDSRFLDIGIPDSYAETEQFFAPRRRSA